jgi:hypothetical protein
VIIKAPKLRCARCDTRLANPATRVFSKATRLHYCGDLTGCARRAARKQRQVAA